jgi:hypothetical protein
MKTKLITLSLMITFQASLFAQVSGKSDSFENIRIQTKALVLSKNDKTDKIYLMSDSTDRIEITGSSISLSELPIKIENNTLSINNPLNLPSNATLVVHVKKLRSLSLRGGTDVASKNSIQSDELKIEVSGSSDLDMEMNANKIFLNTSGAGNIKLKGKTGDFTIDASGASDVKAFDLQATRCKVSSSGASDIKLNVSESLVGDVHGAGNITYMGEPSKLNVDVSGAGSLEKRNGNNSSTNKDEDEDDKEVMIQLGKKKFALKDLDDDEEDDHKSDAKELRSMWSGLEFGINGYSTASQSIGMPDAHPYFKLNYGKSFVFNLNFYEENIPIYKEYLGILVGLGMEFNRYQFAERYRLQNIPDTLTGVFTGARYRTNMLRTTSFTMPLMLQMQTNSNPKKGVGLAMGVIGAWRPWTAKLIQSAYVDDVYQRSNTHSDYYINPFRLMAAVRIAVRKVEVFSSYGLTPLFAKGKTIELFPFTLGIRLFSF